MKIKAAVLTAMAAGLGSLAVSRIRSRSRVDLRGKVVLITGGSRGLGLAVAREFATHGSIVAICARDQDELKRATEGLHASGAKAHSFVCDVADPEQVQAMIADVTRLLGHVDVLVNNAGVIKVGPFAQMDPSDFEEAMNVMFWGTLHATLAVLPAMRERQHGSIVNITSIGGKITVPHLLPYCCAKFAAVALSEGLGIELAPEGIRVTTIVPGLMRTGSHLNAKFKGRQNAEYGWFAAGAASPAVSISAESAARSIVEATIRGDREKILSLPAELLASLQGIAPALVREILDATNRFLPEGEGGSGHSVPGRMIEAQFKSPAWKEITRLGRNAAVSLNEVTRAT